MNSQAVASKPASPRFKPLPFKTRMWLQFAHSALLLAVIGFNSWESKQQRLAIQTEVDLLKSDLAQAEKLTAQWQEQQRLAGVEMDSLERDTDRTAREIDHLNKTNTWTTSDRKRIEASRKSYALRIAQLKTRTLGNQKLVEASLKSSKERLARLDQLCPSGCDAN